MQLCLWFTSSSSETLHMGAGNELEFQKEEAQERVLKSHSTLTLWWALRDIILYSNMSWHPCRLSALPMDFLGSNIKFLSTILNARVMVRLKDIVLYSNRGGRGYNGTCLSCKLIQILLFVPNLSSVYWNIAKALLTQYLFYTNFSF